MARNKKNILKTEVYSFSENNSSARNSGEFKLKSLESLTYSNSSKYRTFFDILNKTKDIKSIELDLSEIKVFDTYAYVFIQRVKKHCQTQSIKYEITGTSSEFDNFFLFLSSKKAHKIKKEKMNFFYSFFIDIGNAIKYVSNDLILFTEFVGEVSKRIFSLPANFKKVRWEDFPTLLIRVGVNSIAICLLIVFLIGIIIGYVSAIQLARFGVGSFLAALVGIAVTRELSPLMVGIIMAGRSGSAFTAEIGTMKVSEEIAALTSFGFDRQYFLVLPRLIATVISAPLLVSICNVAGILGGYLAGAAVLGLTFPEFQVQLLDSTLSYYDLLGGVGKSIIFGFIISVVGCFKGFQVSGGAESVGKFTTSSVVMSIFSIILVDAIFAFIL